MAVVRVKICCISSLTEAQLAIDHGASALGLVGDMPSGPGVIDDTLAREIAAQVPPGVDTFLLTSRDSGDAICDHAEYCGASVVQIVRHIDVAEHAVIARRLRTGRGGVRCVQVIHVEDAGALELVKRYEPWVHAFLLDSGRPAAPIAELGGTGRAHDWRISAAIVRSTSKPVFLAGGLTPANVRDAVRLVQPFGVDVCSGVRTDGSLDTRKLRAFMENAGVAAA